MWGPQRRQAHETARRREQACDRVDARDLQRSRVVEQRQDPGQPAGEHRLPDAGWAREQNVVPSRGRQLERTPCAGLPADVGQVGRCDGRRGRKLVRRGRSTFAAEVGDRLGEVTHRYRLDARERDFRPRLGGADEAAEPRAARAFGSRECAGYRAQASVECELSDRRVAVEAVAWDLVRGGQDGERDREIEARPLLAEIRGREVDGDAAPGPLELGGGDAAADAVLRLLAGAVGKADDRERRHAVRQVRFDLDAARVEPEERVGGRACEHVATVGSARPSRGSPS